MSAPTETEVRSRIGWVDNLRVAAITGVIVVHTATAYVTDFADWYYHDELHPTTVGFAIFAIPALMAGIFGLGPLFWLAGWFSVPALRHRGPLRFATSRVVRLGAPLAVFVVVVNPTADLVGSMRRVDRSFLDYLGETEFSVMWFVVALLFCSLAYAGLRAIVPGRATHRPGWRAAVLAAVLIGAVSVGLWPLTSPLDGHLMSVRFGAWPQGIALFALGVLAAEASSAPDTPADADPGVDRRAERRWGWLTVAGLVAIITLVGLGSSDDGDLGELLHEMPWQSVVFAMVYGLVSVSFCLWCLAWFRRTWTGTRPWLERAGRASYATYLLHPLVLTCLMAGLWWLPLPAEAKFVLVVGVGAPLCFLVGHLVTSLPGARRVL